MFGETQTVIKSVRKQMGVFRKIMANNMEHNGKGSKAELVQVYSEDVALIKANLKIMKGINENLRQRL